MQTFLSILTTLAVLLQGLNPVVACGLCTDCVCATTGHCAEGESSVSSPETERLHLPACCCAGESCASDSEPVTPHDASVKPADSSCECHVQAMPEGLPVPVSAANVWLTALLLQPAVSALQWELPPTCALPAGDKSADDRTRPHRAARCHLLDCVWLI